MNNAIKDVEAIEILDSRGFPTIRVRVLLEDGSVGISSVPSGASTGSREAIELRDHDSLRYFGKGVTKAVENIRTEIGKNIVGVGANCQTLIDNIMIELDGTENKARLGANAILGVSQAVAVAAAASAKLPLYQYLGGLNATHLPLPMMNVINGGKHADSSLDFQEFMVVPFGAPSFREALRYGSEIFQCLKKNLQKKGYSTAVGDEGGFAPQLSGGNEEACELIVSAIESAGYIPGRDVGIALDPAASSFYSDGQYDLRRSKQGYKSVEEMIDLYRQWVESYPIVSIEDGLAENDWGGFSKLTAKIGKTTQIVGDDIFVTNKMLISRGVAESTCNAVLIKLNQIGTVSETIAAIHLCRQAGWGIVVSHRSGETEDTFLADFAVAMGGGQIKTGSLCRSERVAKFNRLLEIESELGAGAEFGK